MAHHQFAMNNWKPQMADLAFHSDQALPASESNKYPKNAHQYVLSRTEYAIRKITPTE